MCKALVYLAVFFVLVLSVCAKAKKEKEVVSNVIGKY